MWSRTVAALWIAAVPVAAPAQTWNSPDARSLVDRAIARRRTVQADSGLRNFRARAHGFVFFLGQLGEGFAKAPWLVKSDQLALEVYWQAPGLSKQVIIGRRDRRDLPTDIQYHRDHLGIVQNNFGDSIRFGDGDEVRDAPHPLSPNGPRLYDYLLGDSLTIELPERAVRVDQVLVRPKDFTVPGVVGTLFIDVETAEVVRFRFDFTAPAYRDHTVEDITVVLDNGLWFGRYWLPRRQEIEIRRRTSWLDFPVRGIIRGRWEIGSYEFNVALPPGLFAAGEPEIVNAPSAVRDTFRWEEPLDVAIAGAAGPAQRADLQMVRAEMERLVANRALTGLPRTRPAFGSISDVVHVNRVEGLTPGFGWLLRPGAARWELRGWGSYGFSDQRPKARVSVIGSQGPFTVELRAAREIRDIGDEPVISPALNSLLAQEGGVDFGDYVLMEQATLGLRRGRFLVQGGIERPTSVGVAAQPAAGRYRPNPPLGGPANTVARLLWERAAPAGGARLSAEVGAGGGRRYARMRGAGDARVRAGVIELRFAAWLGWASTNTPGYRAFVLGGRGTLLGDSFRAWGGRYAGLGRVEWRLPVPFPALPLGAFGSTGSRALLAPFVAAGSAGGSIPGAPWVPTGEVRVVAGAALEVFQGLLRAELGADLRDRRVGFAVDVRRDLWPIL